MLVLLFDNPQAIPAAEIAMIEDRIDETMRNSSSLMWLDSVRFRCTSLALKPLVWPLSVRSGPVHF